MTIDDTKYKIKRKYFQDAKILISLVELFLSVNYENILYLYITFFFIPWLDVTEFYLPSYNSYFLRISKI